MVLSILGGSEEGSKILRKEEGIKTCLNLFLFEDDQIVNTASAVVWNLGQVPENLIEMAKLNVGVNLSNLLDSKDPDTIEKGLGGIVTCCKNKEIGIQFKKSEGIDKIIPFLENFKYEKITTYALLSIAVLAIDDDNKDDIREAGALGPLITLLSNQNENFIEKSLSGLVSLSLNQKNRVTIRQLDGIPVLIDLLFHENPSIQKNAAGVLWNLCNDERCKKLIREMGK
jgi:hypothetical protein